MNDLFDIFSTFKTDFRRKKLRMIIVLMFVKKVI